MGDLRSRFQSLVEIYAHQWTIIAKTLTSEGYKTPTGLKIWSKNCARKYFNRNLRTNKKPYDPATILPGIGAARPITGYLDWWEQNSTASARFQYRFGFDGIFFATGRNQPDLFLC